jgi:hypothetical protein
MRKKQRYGGLSPRHVRLIRDYLHKVYNSAEAWNALQVWTWLLLSGEHAAIEKAKTAGLGKSQGRHRGSEASWTALRLEP